MNIESNREPIICFKEVSFSYADVSVLHKINLDIFQLDFASIVGPNGGGKTTLLKLILGLITPAAGNLRVFGQSARKSRKRVGYVPQYVHFDPLFPISVMEVVLMGRLGYHTGGRFTAEDRQLADEAIDKLMLSDQKNRLFSDLSGGQRQRVLIARALCSQPDVILLDEPTANIDAQMETQLFSILKKLNESMAVLIVSHDLGFVSQMVTRVICVNRTIAIHPTSEVTGDLIQNMYGDDKRMVRHDHHCPEAGHHHD